MLIKKGFILLMGVGLLFNVLLVNASEPGADDSDDEFVLVSNDQGSRNVSMLPDPDDDDFVVVDYAAPVQPATSVATTRRASSARLDTVASDKASMHGLSSKFLDNYDFEEGDFEEMFSQPFERFDVSLSPRMQSPEPVQDVSKKHAGEQIFAPSKKTLQESRSQMRRSNLKLEESLSLSDEKSTVETVVVQNRRKSNFDRVVKSLMDASHDELSHDEVVKKH